jgi:hypothetical protein
LADVAGGRLKLTLPKPAETFICDFVEARATKLESGGKTGTPPPDPILSEVGGACAKTVMVPIKPFGLATVKARLE